MASRRIAKVNSLLREVLSEVLRRDLKDPSIPDLITITSVDTSADLQHAKVFISLIEDNLDKKNQLIKHLQKSAGYIAVLASKKVSLRYFPALTFKIDDSIDQFMKIDLLLQKINKTKSEDV